MLAAHYVTVSQPVLL